MLQPIKIPAPKPAPAPPQPSAPPEPISQSFPNLPTFEKTIGNIPRSSQRRPRPSHNSSTARTDVAACASFSRGAEARRSLPLKHINQKPYFFEASFAASFLSICGSAAIFSL
jgi:hypothetical protein